MTARVTRPRATCVVVLTVAFATVAPARAQSAEFRQVVGEAVGEFNRGHYREALALFRRAHELEPSARTRRGLGMTLFELRQYVEALRELQEALGEPRLPLEPDQREHVTGLIDRAHRFVGRFRLELSPQTARAVAGGGELRGDAPLVLPIGEHEIEVSAEGHEPETRRLDVQGGEDLVLSIALRRRETAPAPAPPSAAAPDEVASQPAPGPSGVRRALIGAGISTLAGAVATGVGWGLTRSNAADCADAIDNPSRGCRNLDELETRRTALGVVSFAGAAIGVAALAIALVLRPADGSDAEVVSAACAPAPGGVSCRGWLRASW